MKGARLRLPEQLSISVGSERMWGEGEKGDDDGVCDNDAEKLQAVCARLCVCEDVCLTEG